MAKVLTSTEFVAKLKDIAEHYKTLYVMGCIGAPLTPANKKRYTQNHSYNKKPARTAMINAATSDTFGFDCVCTIKATLWNWNGNLNAVYGGATYGANGVPDIGADAMITYCSGVSTDFSKIDIGEAVWLKGHIGVYIGDGLVVECSPKWKNGVQITAVGNIGAKAGYNMRTWTKHGKLPWVDYSPVLKPIDEIVQEVLAGKWGTGSERKRRLTQAGYNYTEVQAAVNAYLEAEKKAKGDVDGDGKITAADARMAMRAAVGLEKLNDKQKKAADMDNDGKITAADAREIMRKAVGLDEK